MAKFVMPASRLTKADETVYTAPSTGAIIIGMNASHAGEVEGTCLVNVMIKRGSTTIYLWGKNSLVFPSTSLTLGTGKVVLLSGDELVANSEPTSGEAKNSIDLSVSIMEF